MNRFPAPAKINLHLKVTRTLDNGYHELDTSFVYVDVGDTLTITPSEELIVTCSESSLNGEKNLVYKVLHALQKQFGVQSGVTVHIDKALPHEAGLGGGSSDAATALMIANQTWGLNLSIDTLISFAAPFGADIPCFLFGQASLAHGVGEKLVEYPGAIPDGALLLAYPGAGLSTATVFNCYDHALAGDTTLTHQVATDTIRARSGRPIGENDLEACACYLSCEVERLLSQMRKLSETAWMSGSGSTCVALFKERQQAEEAAGMLQQQQLATWTHVGELLKEHPIKQLL
jgi:4-diphosphocytidyl-2-C-methyl-D-erythritol kinase